MTVTEEIRQKLVENFSPIELEIVDESENHRGHAGFREGGESHFNVTLRSEKFAYMSRIEWHRAVHHALGADLVGRIHALALTLSA